MSKSFRYDFEEFIKNNQLEKISTQMRQNQQKEATTGSKSKNLNVTFQKKFLSHLLPTIKSKKLCLVFCMKSSLTLQNPVQIIL